MKVNLIATPKKDLYDYCPKGYTTYGISRDKEYEVFKIRDTKYNRFITLINDNSDLIEINAGAFSYKTV